MTEYLDISALEKNDILYLLEGFAQILSDYELYRQGVLPEFLSDEYGVTIVERSLDTLEKLEKKMKIVGSPSL
jgi:hypothetical protein